MSELESLYQLIVREFPAEGIRAILVGGHAVNAHGYTRATQDIDFIIDGEQEDLVCQVMKKAGYTNQSRHETVLFCMKPDAVLRVDFLKTDEETMRILWQKRHQMELGKADIVSVADIEHLIIMKLTALRGNFAQRKHKDIPDIVNLARLNQWSFEKTLAPLIEKHASREIHRELQTCWESTA